MNNVDNAVNQLIAVIQDSETYHEYVKQLEKVKQQPELKYQIDDFRTRNYKLQTSGEAAFERIEEFEREYMNFLENPCVSDFLEAELAFCRMMQDINIRITEAMHFE